MANCCPRNDVLGKITYNHRIYSSTLKPTTLLDLQYFHKTYIKNQ